MRVGIIIPTLFQSNTMGLQTMSNTDWVPEEMNVGRSDPVYMAHSYLTKVPVSAIIPFLESYTKPGDVVLDPFAGSGMTGVAAAMTGRRARLHDISVLGKHVGRGYVNLVDETELAATAKLVVEAARAKVGQVYGVPSEDGSRVGEMVKTVWSVIVRCGQCSASVNYYRALETADWSKPGMVCPACSASVSSKNPRIGDEGVVDFVRFVDARIQVEQAHTEPLADLPPRDTIGFPRVEIPADREMFAASALGKSGLTSVDSFYTTRNLYVLTALWEEIQRLADAKVRGKLLFAFTACLSRASRRYQWSRARPLNAANANYYVAPVYYEWNVFDLFERKVDSAINSDRYLLAERATRGLEGTLDSFAITYDLGSAVQLDHGDATIDYVFTDPPFGSNLFYADMALFQEAWLEDFTDVTSEAVIDRTKTGSRSPERYESLIEQSLVECRRVLKPGAYLSMVFGNSSGAVWSMVQRAIRAAGLEVVPDRIVVLNKGQRSVKGLASGFEHTATLDLIITMAAKRAGSLDAPLTVPTVTQVEQVVARLLTTSIGRTPSHLYLELLRSAFEANWSVEALNLRHVVDYLKQSGVEVDGRTGQVVGLPT